MREIHKLEAPGTGTKTVHCAPVRFNKIYGRLLLHYNAFLSIVEKKCELKTQAIGTLGWKLPYEIMLNLMREWKHGYEKQRRNW